MKISKLKDLFNKPISSVEFIAKDVSKISEISKLTNKEGSTEVTIKVDDSERSLVFKLKKNKSIHPYLLDVYNYVFNLLYK